jgi:hypothetical protein
LLLDKLDEFKPSIGRESVDVGDVGLLAVRNIAGKSLGQKLNAETLLGSRTMQAVEDRHEGEFSEPSGSGVELQDAKSFLCSRSAGLLPLARGDACIFWRLGFPPVARPLGVLPP